MERFLLNLGKLSLLGGVVIAVLLVLRPLLSKRYCAEMYYRLWLILTLLLLLPFDYSLKSAPVQLEKPMERVMVWTDHDAIMPEIANKSHVIPSDEAENPSGEGNTQSLSVTPARRSIDTSTVLFFLWLMGVTVFATLHLVRYARFHRLVHRWKKDCTQERFHQLMSEESERVGVKPPRFAVCEAIPTPMLLGIVRPVMLLPHEDYPEIELSFILRHELTHLKCHDMVCKLLLLGANTLHWFNPLVYLMLRAADEDIELACDSAATYGMERTEKAAYSKTLLAAAQNKTCAVPATTCFGGTVKRLKRRITNVLSGEKRQGVGIAVFIVISAVALGAVVSWSEKEVPEQLNQIEEPSAEPEEPSVAVEQTPTESEEPSLTVEQTPTEQETPPVTVKTIVEYGEFINFFGISGYFEIEKQAYGFCICRYYEPGGTLLAESYGYGIDDYGVDFDRDGVYELVCNCVGGADGHKEVFIYRLKNGNIELGWLDMEKLNLHDYLNWGANSTACHYDAQSGEFVLSYTSAKDNTKQNEKICTYEDFTFSVWTSLRGVTISKATVPSNTSEPTDPPTAQEVRTDILKNADALIEGEGVLWYIADGYFSHYVDGGAMEHLYKLPLADDGETPVLASLTVKDGRIALTYHVGGATRGHSEMRLFDDEGKQVAEIIGYGLVAVERDTIVKTTGFVPPAPDNLRVSHDSGKTWENLGDPKYLYGMNVVVGDPKYSDSTSGGTISYSTTTGEFTIQDGYLYTTGIDWAEATSQASEALSLRIDLHTGETMVGID